MGLVRERLRVCKYCGDLHDVRRVPDNCREPAAQRSDYPSPYVISDALPGGVNGLYHHAALRKYDSKSEYRAATKAAGCIEVGGERDALDRLRLEDKPMAADVIESGVNEALHQLGISSDSDTRKLDYGGA